MEKCFDELELVIHARHGCKESLNSLAGIARQRLRVYVYRMTLDEDLTQEIVQESMLEMCRILGKLKDSEKFWPWLYGIATNKLRRHHRNEAKQKRLAANKAARTSSPQTRHSGFENLVGQELKQVVSEAMKNLKTSHRSVLIMRCYDGMSYAQIAESMDSSEFGTRMLFLRAKRALQKQLLNNGFGKKTLIPALILFGRMTAPTEAAAADISVSAATMQVGLAAGIVGAAATKAGVAALAAAGVVTAGSMMAATGPTTQSNSGLNSSSIFNDSQSVRSSVADDSWYYFPDGPDGAVMIRTRLDSSGSSPDYILQNDRGNYHYSNGVVYTNNHRMYQPDLAVTRLPVDSRKLSEFLANLDGRIFEGRHIAESSPDLFIVACDEEGSTAYSVIKRHHNVLDEEYFRGDWPAHAKIVDNRDAMHKRGWTFFTISGRLNGRAVSGRGCLPFVYAASKVRRPWLEVKVAGASTLVDDGIQAIIRDGTSSNFRYEGGAFFEGLMRPWMGLHSIDTIRRDAAKRGVVSTIESTANGHAGIELVFPETRLAYDVDLDADLINKIEFFSNGVHKGELTFTYLQQLPTESTDYVRPQLPANRRSNLSSPEVLWLTRLLNETM